MDFLVGLMIGTILGCLVGMFLICCFMVIKK
jgi:hypothetical protein